MSERQTINIGVSESRREFDNLYPDSTLGLKPDVKRACIDHALEYGNSNVKWVGVDGAVNILICGAGIGIEVSERDVEMGFKKALEFVSGIIKSVTNIDTDTWVSEAYADYWTVSYSVPDTTKD